jgi:hypothetical protein
MRHEMKLNQAALLDLRSNTPSISDSEASAQIFYIFGYFWWCPIPAALKM